MTEKIREEVKSGKRIEFAEGISKKYEIEKGDSLRVELVSVNSKFGQVLIDNISEEFVVDLDSYQNNQFQIPDDITNLYDIDDKNIIQVKLLEIIKDNETIAIDGYEHVNDGEELILQVDQGGQKVEFADGISRKYNIDKGNSLRVKLTKILDHWGNSQDEDINREFIIDLDAAFNNQFEIPSPITNLYDISEDDFVELTLLEVIKPDKCIQIKNHRDKSASKQPQQISSTLTKERPSLPAINNREIDINQYQGNKPTREILESIVADSLESLGFDVRANEYIDAKGDETVEVDVWAERNIANTTFHVYTSCKNWKNSVDKGTIDQELGRTRQLLQTPHLRILIVGELTSGAKNAAEADGFITVELNKKATTNNAAELHEHIYQTLSGAFFSIAPPKLQGLAMEAQQHADELNEIANNIEEFAGRIEGFSR